MEEEILKIIDEVEYAKRNTYIPPAGRQKIMAKKIASLYKDWYPAEFTEWCTMNVIKLYKINKYFIIDKDEEFDTLAELYSHWKLNIKNK